MPKYSQNLSEKQFPMVKISNNSGTFTNDNQDHHLVVKIAIQGGATDGWCLMHHFINNSNK